MPDPVRMWGVWDDKHGDWMACCTTKGHAKDLKAEYERRFKQEFTIIPGTFTPDAEAEDEQD